MLHPPPLQAPTPAIPLLRTSRRASAPLHARPLASSQLQLVLDGESLRYTLRRSARRTIGLTIGEVGGLTVHAPLRTPLAAIEEVLVHKARWIHAHLARALSSEGAARRPTMVWADGAELPFLGAPLRLALTPPRAGRYAVQATLDRAPQPALLRLLLPADAGATAIQAATLRWLQREARRLFTARLDHYTPQMGVRWSEMRLTAARTRWGSASARGVIRLNWKLMHFALPLIDYVVVHELAHLLEMNHGARFWAHVERVLPDYQARRDALKTSVLPPY